MATTTTRTGDSSQPLSIDIMHRLHEQAIFLRGRVTAAPHLFSRFRQSRIDQISHTIIDTDPRMGQTHTFRGGDDETGIKWLKQGKAGDQAWSVIMREMYTALVLATHRGAYAEMETYIITERGVMDALVKQAQAMGILYEGAMFPVLNDQP